MGGAEASKGATACKSSTTGTGCGPARSGWAADPGGPRGGLRLRAGRAGHQVGHLPGPQPHRVGFLVRHRVHAVPACRRVQHRVAAALGRLADRRVPGAAAIGSVGYLASGEIWTTALAVWVYAGDLLVFGALSVSFPVAIVTRTPGCEFNAMPRLVARLRGTSDEETRRCILGVDLLD